MFVHFAARFGALSDLNITNDLKTVKRKLSFSGCPKRFKNALNDTETHPQQRSPSLISTPGITFRKKSAAKELPKFEEIINEPITNESSLDESETSTLENSRATSEIMKILVDENSIWASPSVTKISNSRLKAAIDSILVKEPNVPEPEGSQVYFYGFSQRIASTRKHSMQSIVKKPESIKEYKRKDNNIDDSVYEDVVDDQNNIL
ncbi:Hypothetical protein CINCED_3A021039 [Cinara cedri]|uniref:Uncharacterized protein n=1 Tax=Cinara cedri TaxID=506608 RepID=A0A5E4NE84_9HEMI|nr:Hypothetical protein CINCED_3A021039 [Cinara cedri]